MPDGRSFRASDEDRERVVAVLREQMVAGRLTSDELDERVGAAYAARTWGELRAIVSDLPVTLRFADERAPLQPVPSLRPSRPERGPSVLLPVVIAWIAILIIGERLIFLAPIVLFAMIVTLIVLLTGPWARRL